MKTAEFSSPSSICSNLTDPNANTVSKPDEVVIDNDEPNLPDGRALARDVVEEPNLVRVDCGDGKGYFDGIVEGKAVSFGGNIDVGTLS